MKIHPVVRLGHLVALVSWCACDPSNGSLFDEVVAPPAAVNEPASAGDDMPSVMAPAPEPTPEPSTPDDGERPPEMVGQGASFLGGVLGPPQPPEAAPEAPEPPRIVSVSPADGARGVQSDARIVIEFSKPMDREATQAAYQSESIPSGSVSFVWNDAGTELTVVPEAPLEYAAGSDPEQVEARRVSFFISASAADAEGRRLAQPYEFSFALLRQIELTLFALQDRDMSGNFRSNDTYGGGQCARAQVNVCVGDSRVDGDNEQYKGFVSFELGELPDELQDLSARLSLEITALSGNPFGGLGGLVLEHARFDAIDIDAFDADPLSEMGLLGDDGDAGTVLRADVSSAVTADQAAGGLTQYRLRFEDQTDDDGNSDVLISAVETQTLDLVYLLP